MLHVVRWCPQQAREENAKRAAEKALREKRQKELEVRRQNTVDS